MIRRALILCAALMLGACVETTGSANGRSAVDDAADFDAALASIGCELKFESDYLPVELQTGMSREQVQSIAATKVSRGQAIRTPDGAVRSTVGACAPTATS